MILYGIASGISEDMQNFFVTRAEAEIVLDAVIADERDLDGMLWVEAIEFETSAN